MNSYVTRAILIFLVLMPFSAFAQTYRIGVENISYYPYSEIQDGQYVGVGRDILDKFASTKGFQFEYVPNPLARNKKLFLSKRLDFLYPDSEYWSKSEKESSQHTILYSQGLVSYVDGISVLSSEAELGFEQLRTVAMLIGFTPVDAYLEQERKSLMAIARNTTVAGLIQQLLLGRVKGVYLSKHVVANQFSLLGKRDLVTFVDRFPKHQGAYKLSTIMHSDVIKALDKFLSTHNDEISLIKRKYNLPE